MTTPHALFAGLALIASAIFAGHFTNPAGSQATMAAMRQSHFIPMATGADRGGDPPSVWRMDAQNARVSWCTVGHLASEPVCTPWSKKEPAS